MKKKRHKPITTSKPHVEYVRQKLWFNRNNVMKSFYLRDYVDPVNPETECCGC